jgi:zinc finger protein BrlA
MGASHTEDFVNPSQTTFMDTFDLDSPLQSARTLQFNLSYDTPISDYNYGFEQFIPTTYQDLIKSCSTTPSRPSPLRQPMLEPISTAALQRVQGQSPANKEEFKRTQTSRKAHKAIKRAKRDYLLPSNVHVQKLADKQCPFQGCTRKFVRQEHLKRHVKTHTQSDVYPCQFCTRPFGRPDNLKDHIKRHAQPPKKSSRTSYYEGAQAVYDRMSRKSPIKSENIKREDDMAAAAAAVKTRSRARISGY